MVTLRITKENFENLMGTYFKVCELLDPETNIDVLDIFVGEDAIDINVDVKLNKETMN